MDKLNAFIDKVVEAIDKRQAKRTEPRVTQAEVIRTEGDTVFVHIPGGADETPVKKTIACKKGDTVQVRVSNPSVIVGNNTAPPTDDTKAVEAEGKAEDAAELAEEAKAEATGTKQHFWYMNGESSEAGAHVTEVPGEVFRENPQGANLLMRSGGVFLRLALTVLLSIVSTGMKIFEPTDDTNPTAQFLSTGTIIGKENGIHIVVGSGKVSFYDDSTLLFEVTLTSQPPYDAVIRKEGVTGQMGAVQVSGDSAEVEGYYNANGVINGANASASADSSGAFAGILADYDDGNTNTTADIEVGAGANGSYCRITSDDNIIQGDMDIDGKLTAGSLDCGSGTFSTFSSAYGDKTVSFNKTFATAPNVVACLTVGAGTTAANNGELCITVLSVSTTDFTVRCFNNTGSSKTPGFNWIALS